MILIREEDKGNVLIDYKINDYGLNSITELIIKDKKAPSGVEPNASYRVDYYILDRDITYRETRSYIGTSVYVGRLGYSYFTPKSDSIKSDLFSYFKETSCFPTFVRAVETLTIIPDPYLRCLFWFDPVRGHQYDYYASCRMRTKDGWLLYIIRSNKIEADAYIAVFTEGKKHPYLIHIFNGQEVDAEPWNIDYEVRERNNRLRLKTYLYSNKKKEINSECFYTKL